MSNQTAKTRRLAKLSLLVALEAVLFLTPFGLIVVPPVSITTMHIPVIVAGIAMGPVSGAIVGGVFGLLSLAKATFAAVSPVDMMFSPFLSGNPIASLVMCVGVRIIFGAVSGYLYRALKNTNIKNAVSAGIVAAFSTMIHTIMVLGCLSLFFSVLSLRNVFAAIITINGLLEILGAVVISSALASPLGKSGGFVE